jgi:predicted nucleotidyltransferase
VTRSQQARWIAAALREEIGDTEVYVFGSWTRDQPAHDVDVLVVYDEARLADTDVSDLRRRIRQEVRRLVRLPAHVVALTVEEARETDFVRRECCVPLAALSAIDAETDTHLGAGGTPHRIPPAGD